MLKQVEAFLRNEKIPESPFSNVQRQEISDALLRLVTQTDNPSLRLNFELFGNLNNVLPNKYLFDPKDEKIMTDADSVADQISKIRSTHPWKRVLFFHGKCNVPHLRYVENISLACDGIFRMGFRRDEIIVVIGCMNNEYIHSVGKESFLDTNSRMALMSTIPQVDYVFPVNLHHEDRSIMGNFFSNLYTKLGVNFTTLEIGDPNEKERLRRNELSCIITLRNFRQKIFSQNGAYQLNLPFYDISSTRLLNGDIDEITLIKIFNSIKNPDENYLDNLYLNHKMNRSGFDIREYAKMLGLIP